MSPKQCVDSIRAEDGMYINGCKGNVSISRSIMCSILNFYDQSMSLHFFFYQTLLKMNTYRFLVRERKYKNELTCRSDVIL